MWVAGVDGFRSRWCVVLRHLGTKELKVRIVPTFAELLSMEEKPVIVAVDIPIGLPEYAVPGGRSCEREARQLLGKRASSVFSAVGRAVLNHSTRLEAHLASRQAGGLGVGAQAWGLTSKLREVDAAILPEHQKVVYEVHPELSFRAMNNGAPMPYSKKSAAGEQARRDVLIRAGFSQEFIQRLGAPLRVGRDDFLDACAAAWTAGRVASGSAERCPANPELDGLGLDQAMWF